MLKQKITKIYFSMYNNKRSSYYMIYTVLFILITSIFYSYFWINDKSLIRQADSLYQHYPALVYFGKYIRETVRGVLENGFTSPIRLWDLRIGLGADILTTLHYYVIGDPFALLAALVSQKNTEYLYDFLVFLRLYFAGISYSIYCNYFRFSRKNILVGSFVYVFFHYTFNFAITHPFFLNPMIWLPLIFLGIEKLFKGEKPYIFIFSVFVSCISNFYFFYVLTILMILYSTIRYFSLGKSIALIEIIKTIFYFGKYYLISIFMAAPILLPVIIATISTTRSEKDLKIQVFYDFSYYVKLFGNMFSIKGADRNTYLGLPLIVLVSIIILFRRRKYQAVKAGWVLGGILLIFPFFGSVFSGFTYASNRWAFIFGFLGAITVTIILPQLEKIKTKDLHLLTIIAIIYISLCFLNDVLRNVACLTTGITFLIYILIFEFFKTKKIANTKWYAVMMTMLVLNISINIFFLLSPSESTILQEFVERGTAYERQTNDSARELANLMTKGEIARYSENRYYQRSDYNTSLISDLYSTKYYFSLADGNISNYMFGVNNNIKTDNSFKGFDGRTILETLANVKYYQVNSSSIDYVPYGFSYTGTSHIDFNGTEYLVYENDNYLPFGYVYNKYINMEQYENASPLQRQEMMLYGVFLEEVPSNIETIVYNNTNVSLKHTFQADDDIILEDNKIYVNRENAQLRIFFDDLSDGELYLVISNIEFEGKKAQELSDSAGGDKLSKYQNNQMKRANKYWMSPAESIVSINAGSVKKEFSIQTPEYNWYTGIHDYTINLGYQQDSELQEIVLEFAQMGEYTFDELNLISFSLEDYEAQINNLCSNTLKNVKMQGNTISGEIVLEEQGVLCLSLPYSSGWKAYIDGERVELSKANVMYMGLEIGEGKHQVELKYRTPGLCVGLLCFGMGCSVLVIEGLLKFKYGIKNAK